MHYWQRQGQSSLPPCPHLGLQAISRSSRSDQGGGSGEAPATQLMVSAVGAGGGDVEGVSRSEGLPPHYGSPADSVTARAEEEDKGGGQLVGGDAVPSPGLTRRHIPIPGDLGPHDARHISRKIVLHADDLGAMHTVDALGVMWRRQSGLNRVELRQ